MLFRRNDNRYRPTSIISYHLKLGDEMMKLNLPARLRKKLLRTFGAPGEEWLKELPAILAKCQEHWELTSGESSPIMSYSYIQFACSPDFGPVVLKIGYQGTELARKSLIFESLALTRYAGKRVCQIYDELPQLGAVLLERFCPGTNLTTVLERRKRVEIAAGLAREIPVEIHGELDLPLHTDIVQQTFSRLPRRNPAGEEMKTMANKAEEWLLEIDKNRPSVLLHADLNHYNILSNRDTWKAIDPKGQIGAACLEIGRFIINEMWMMDQGDKRKDIAQIVEQLSREMGEDQQIIGRSAFIDKALSLSWQLEEMGLNQLQDAVKDLSQLYETCASL